MKPIITLSDETTVLIGPGLIITELGALDERDDLGIGQVVEIRQGADRYAGTVADITEEKHPPFRVFIHIKTANPLKDAMENLADLPPDPGGWSGAFPPSEDEDRLVTSECPTCGLVTERRTYDIGSGPELSCANCEWCWGADGQPLKPLTYKEIAEQIGFDPFSRIASQQMETSEKKESDQ